MPIRFDLNAPFTSDALSGDGPNSGADGVQRGGRRACLVQCSLQGSSMSLQVATAKVAAQWSDGLGEWIGGIELFLVFKIILLCLHIFWKLTHLEFYWSY